MGRNSCIRWLHLSDLHLGCRGAEVWWQVHSEFRDSLKKHFRPLDMILLTGDLTNQGSPEQFEMVDRFLGTLVGWLRDAGQKTEPLVIPVPGNHDLVRPKGMNRANLSVLKNFWKNPDDEILAEFKTALWQDHDASAFAPLFKNYQDWLSRSILPKLSGPGVSHHCSHFPGDLSVRIDRAGAPPLTVVGLNSAWLQFDDDDVERRIELFTQQLHCALENNGRASPLNALDGRLRLLMMHHPLSWLSQASRKRFNEEIYTPDRFLLNLHGHMHEARSEAVAICGGLPRYHFQAPSLFGLERYGTTRESRSMGYAWGEVDASGTIRVWPMKRVSQGGRQVFVWDQEFEEDKNGHQIRPFVATPTSLAPTAVIDRQDQQVTIPSPSRPKNLVAISSLPSKAERDAAYAAVVEAIDLEVQAIAERKAQAAAQDILKNIVEDRPRDKSDDSESASQNGSKHKPPPLLDRCIREEDLINNMIECLEKSDVTVDALKNAALGAGCPAHRAKSTEALVRFLMDQSFEVGIKLLKTTRRKLRKSDDQAIKELAGYVIPWLYIGSVGLRDHQNWEHIPDGELIPFPAKLETLAEIVAAGLDRRQARYSGNLAANGVWPKGEMFLEGPPPSRPEQSYEDTLLDNLWALLAPPVAGSEKVPTREQKIERINNQLDYKAQEKGIRFYVILNPFDEGDIDAKSEYDQKLQAFSDYPAIAVIDMKGLVEPDQKIFNSNMRDLIL